jgi:2-keto-4-pentenoate hydratase/2-oxohepta-3-ene-1,7-dioic acid hydratase in catechol pathway
MRYVRYCRTAGGAPRVGLLDGGDIVDVGFDGEMVDFIAEGAPHGRLRDVPDARLLAPLVPRSMRDFLQFKGHLDNAFSRLDRAIPAEFYTVPAYYKGMPDTVIGPGDVIPWPAYTDRLDHELELACVIGRPGRDIPATHARTHIFGWTIWNDVSARDVQTRELPLALGPGKAKDWDGSNVLGPCIVTSDELDASDLAMSVRVNGVEWGRDRSSRMQHGFPDLIAYASRAQTLYPGELLGSGTAEGGSGLELDRWLRPGDLVELEIEGIGVLANEIGRPLRSTEEPTQEGT